MQQILEKNGGDLTNTIDEWNNRGKKIDTSGYSGFLDIYFNSIFTNSLDVVKRIQLAKVLGIIGSQKDFLIFDRYLPRILPNFGVTKITKFI